MRNANRFGWVGLLWAAAGPAVSAEVFHLDGRFAMAFFNGVDVPSCVETSVVVNASDVRVQRPPGAADGRETRVYVAIVQENACTYELVTTIFAEGAVDADALDIAGSLGHGVLQASLPTVDYISGSALTLRIDVAWYGDGERSTDPYHFNFHAAERIVNLHTVGRSVRGLQASGTVAGGTVDFLDGLTAQTASLAAGSSGRIIVE